MYEFKQCRNSDFRVHYTSNNILISLETFSFMHSSKHFYIIISCSVYQRFGVYNVFFSTMAMDQNWFEKGTFTPCKKSHETEKDDNYSWLDAQYPKLLSSQQVNKILVTRYTMQNILTWPTTRCCTYKINF